MSSRPRGRPALGQQPACQKRVVSPRRLRRGDGMPTRDVPTRATTGAAAFSFLLDATRRDPRAGSAEPDSRFGRDRPLAAGGNARAGIFARLEGRDAKSTPRAWPARVPSSPSAPVEHLSRRRRQARHARIAGGRCGDGHRRRWPQRLPRLRGGRGRRVRHPRPSVHGRRLQRLVRSGRPIAWTSKPIRCDRRGSRAAVAHATTSMHRGSASCDRRGSLHDPDVADGP
jgi:hypothetical protein